MKFLCLAGLAGTSALLIAAPATAGTAQGDMLVSATVLTNCTVLATPMVFGDVTQANGLDVDATSTITLACTPNAGYDVALDAGDNASGGVRRLKHATAASFLPYEIYSNAGRTAVWGETSGTNTVSGSANALGVATLTAYGQIDGGEAAVEAGLYADTVTVTVTF